MRRGALATVWLTLFLDLVAFGIIIPVLPYYAEAFGASPKVVTLLSTTFSLAQFAFAPVLGRLSDRHGRRPVMLISIAGSCVAMLSLAWAHALWMVFLARAIGGVSNANISTAHAYVADCVAPAQRAKYMGLMGSAIGLGFVFGPALGGLLSDPGHPELPFLAGAALAAANWVMALVLLPETRTAEARAKATVGRERPRLLRAITTTLWGTPIGWLVLLYFGFFAVFAGMESTFALFCEAAFGWGSRQTGYLFSMIGVVILVTQGLMVGRFVSWLGEKATMLVGFSILAVGLAMAAFAPSVPVLAVGAAGIAMGNGLVTPSMSSMVSQHTSASEQGWAQGLSQSAASFARIIAPIAAGLLFEMVGAGVPMAVGAATLVVVILPIAAAK
ncbi:MAG: MFS transporter, partial [Myxococcota bacterium]